MKNFDFKEELLIELQLVPFAYNHLESIKIYGSLENPINTDNLSEIYFQDMISE